MSEQTRADARSQAEADRTCEARIEKHQTSRIAHMRTMAELVDWDHGDELMVGELVE